MALDELLSEEIASAKRREVSAFDRMVGDPHIPIVLFGAGSLGRRVLACLRQDGVEPLAFADNNRQKWGQSLDGVRILAPQEASERYAGRAAFVVAIWSPGHSYVKTRKQLLELGCTRIVPVLPFLWKHADDLLPHYPFDLPHRLLEQAKCIRRAFELLRDEESYQQYVGHLALLLQANYDALPTPSPEDQYFPADLYSLSLQEVFVDGGAYDGDTIRDLLARQKAFSRILAFEPDPANFQRLSEYISKLEMGVRARIELLSAAIGATRSRVRFDASGGTGASASPNGLIEVECLPLDEVFHDELPTLIKLDIEGAEENALTGAKDTIRRAQPVMAVCAYHRPGDLWRIPLRLYSLNSNYLLFIRSHCDDGMEVVIYAVPPHRRPVGTRHQQRLTECYDQTL